MAEPDAATTAEQNALLAAWGEWIREGRIKTWPQEHAETVYRAFCAAWVAGQGEARASERQRIGQLVADLGDKWAAGYGWTRAQVAAIRHVCQVIAGRIADA